MVSKIIAIGGGGFSMEPNDPCAKVYQVQLKDGKVAENFLPIQQLESYA